LQERFANLASLNRRLGEIFGPFPFIIHAVFSSEDEHRTITGPSQDSRTLLNPPEDYPTLLRKEKSRPKVRLHSPIEEIQGTLYEVVFKCAPNGEMIVTKKPDMSKVKWSKAQKAQRGRIGEASTVVKAALADPKVRAKYERKAKKLGKRARDLAMSDYFKGKDLLGKRGG